MRRKITTFIFLCICTMYSMYSQTFNYQAVVRDAAGDPVINQSIGVLVRIIEGSPTGSVVYNEAHTVTSNNYGVITLPVGGGTSGANFLAIDWSSQNQWIDIQVDITGGTSYTQIGTSKLQFVPYALYALNSNNATNAGPFNYTNNVVSNNNGNIFTDDFVFGSSQLDVNGSNSPAFNNRLFFDKSKAAFRAGYTSGDQWDETKIGDYSVGLGQGGTASGTNSFAMGRNANATGNEAFAFGFNAGGFADYAKGFGLNARAFGIGSIALGTHLQANSYGEVQLGMYSVFTSGDANNWVATDRLFVIGNGQDDINNALDSDALVMLKNGNTTLHGTFTVDADNVGGSTGYTLPGQDGATNQILSTDGVGNVAWVNSSSTLPNGGTNGDVLSTDGSGVYSWTSNDVLPSGGTNGEVLQTDGSGNYSWVSTDDADADATNEIELPTGGTNGQVLATDGSGVYSWVNQPTVPGATFSTTANVTSNAPGDTATDDFVFGSTQIDDISGIPDNNRMIFDKSNAGSFRAGSAFNTDVFNTSETGAGSVGFGVNNKASGTYAATMGNFNTSSGYASFTSGDFNTASGSRSFSAGANNTSSGNNAFTFGLGLTSETFGQTTFGIYNTAVAGNAGTFVDTDRLFVIGNGTADIDGINNSDALVILKNGNTTLNGELTIDGDNQGMEAGYTLPAQDGNANQIMSTDGSGTASWIDAPSGGGGTTLPAGGTNGQILSTDGSGVYTWITDAVDDADADATNEIELPVGGTNGQILATDGSGVYTWVTDAVDDADADATNEIELPVGGADGQVLATDGSGVYTWVDQTAMANVTFATTANVTSNANGTIATDDFVFGSTQLDSAPGNDDNERMFFDKSKGAFRAGSAEDSEWNNVNIGQYSAAFGVDNLASAYGSFAAGGFNMATGQSSIALGDANRALGDFSKAESRGQVSLGVNNTVLAGNATTHIATDRLFVIGNGISATASDALVMLKNGNTTLNGSLTIDGDNQGAGTPYTLPAQDGAANQVMSTNGSGTVSWVTAPADGDSDSTNEIELPVGGSNGNVLQTDGSGGYTWVSNNDGDSDATNEIELPVGGSNGNVLQTDGSGGYTWVSNNDGDSDATNEIELPVGGSNGQVLQTNGSGGYSWTNNTAAPGAYTAATLNSAGGWQYYNAAFGVTTFQDPRYRKVDNVVYLEGLCRKNAAIPNADTIMTLPVGFRPLKTRIFTVETENGAVRVDVNPNGTVLIATGFDVNQNWVSLDGLTFSVD